MSESTIRHTAKVGMVPMILVSNPPDFRRLCQIYQEVAAENGRKLGLGESVGAFRAVPFGDTEARPWRCCASTNYFGFNAYFAGFGFWEAFRFAEDAEKYPLDPYTPLPPSEWTMDRCVNVKYGLAGTVDQVKREIEDVAQASATTASSSGSGGSSTRASCRSTRPSARSSCSPSTSSRSSASGWRSGAAG